MTDIALDIQHQNLERARSTQVKKVEYRSEKRWKIFSWSSSMLIGSIAGAVAIESVSLDCLARIILCLAVLVLASYTVFWLDVNKRYLESALKNLNTIDENLATYININIHVASIPKWLKFVSYELTVSLLSIISILMILLPCLKQVF